VASSKAAKRQQKGGKTATDCRFLTANAVI
jgi:hypothetical protein